MEHKLMHDSPEKSALIGRAPEKSSGHKRICVIALCALGVALAIALIGIVSREMSTSHLKHWNAEQAVPSVKIVMPKRGITDQELVLPADVQAFYEAPIYARVSGYVKMWYQDIGAHVKAGQLLAEIDTPDLDQQLAQAKADLGTAKANEALAVLTAKRWQALMGSNSVSQQSTDEKLGDAEARKAQVASAEANVQRLNALEGFKRIVAPFDGIVTARRTDIGALINAGSGSGSGPELFAVADLHQMRVYTRIPQALSAGLTPGMTAKLKLPQYPDRMFDAKLDTTSNAVASDSRTVLAEFLADNPAGTLWPGTFAEAHIQLPSDPTALSLPSSSLLFRQNGLEVATVDAQNKVVLKPIVPGRDLGTQMQIKSGITAEDRVIDNPPDSLADGDQVKIETNNSNGPNGSNEKGTPASADSSDDDKSDASDNRKNSESSKEEEKPEGDSKKGGDANAPHYLGQSGKNTSPASSAKSTNAKIPASSKEDAQPNSSQIQNNAGNPDASGDKE